MLQHSIILSETLYNRLKTLAEMRGQSVDVLVQATLEDSFEENTLPDETIQWEALLQPLPDPDLILPPYGSQEEIVLRQQLAASMPMGVLLSQMIIDDRGER